jgi:cell division protein FtsB
MGRPGLGGYLKGAALPVGCLLVILYFGNHALFGPSGLLALDDIRQERAALAARHARLEAEQAALERSIRLLDPRGVDPDYADELVRRHLGVVRPDEVIVPLDRVPAAEGSGGNG